MSRQNLRGFRKIFGNKEPTANSPTYYCNTITRDKKSIVHLRKCVIGNSSMLLKAAAAIYLFFKSFMQRYHYDYDILVYLCYMNYR